MNVLQLSFSSMVFWKELVFVETRVGADPKTTHLKSVVAAQRKKFDDVWKSEREVEFAVSETQAKLKTSEFRVYGYMEEVYSATAHEVKQKLKDARYKKLISTSFSRFSRLNFAEQKTDILRMKNVLELDIYGDSFRFKQQELLDQALAEIERIFSVKEGLEKMQRFHRQDVERWKDETNKVRMEVYGELVLLSDSVGDGWARSFFPLRKQVKKLSAEERAAQDAKRAEKRLKKANEKRELEAIKLEEAVKKAENEKKKAELEDQMKKEAKARSDKREADRLAEERRKMEDERLQLDEARRKLAVLQNGGQPTEESASM